MINGKLFTYTFPGRVIMISYLPLNKESWPFLEKLFGDKGACGGCWCMYWRLTGKEYEENKGSSNKAKLQDLIREDLPLGVLAMDRKEAVGWCSVSPRASLKRLENSRLFKKVDDTPVWSITCLFIGKNYREQGLSVKLIDAAARYAFENGAHTIEAYPIIPRQNRMPAVFAWVGFEKAYKQVGFKKIAQPSETRLIMRLKK